MQLGIIGLGRMGANIALRLMRDGHQCVAYDIDAGAVAKLETEGAAGAELSRRPRGGAGAAQSHLAHASRGADG